MRVNIPFQECWREAMLEERKVCTSRGRRYGKQGDIFRAFGIDFELLAVAKMPLKDVSDCLFRQEGCCSPEEFERIWAELHPRAGFVPEKLVYVHWFSKRKWGSKRTNNRP